MSWYLEVWKKYAVFGGRSQRREYWFFMLFSAIIFFVLGVIDGAAGIGDVAVPIYLLATLFPTLAVTVRRLHDTNRSAWWLLISLVPLAGGLILMVLCAEKGVPEANAYGPNPLAAAPAF